jgi:hypothetical protein
VVYPLGGKGIYESGNNMLLADKLFKASRTPFSSENDITHKTKGPANN